MQFFQTESKISAKHIGQPTVRERITVLKGTHNNIEAWKVEPFSIRKISLNILIVSEDVIATSATF